MPTMPLPGTLEQAGITAGSPFLATPEEVATLEEAQLQQALTREAEINGALNGVWDCVCCQHEVRTSQADGLGDACRVLVNQERAKRLAAQKVGGVTRLQLVTAYLDRAAVR